jgi:RNA polymerase sigma-70 factor (ECF subfamily)
LQELNTRDFLGRLKSGDAVAFQTLYSILRPKLCDFIVRLFEIEIGVAEELASDALVKVHRGVKRFDPDGGAKLTTWIFKVAQNTALDHLRKQSKSAPADPFDKVVSQRLEKESTQEMFRERNRELTGGAADSPSSPSSEAQEAIRQLNRALDSLSEADRSILLMRQVMSYEEISQAEKISIGAVRTRYSRALERLREALEREENHEQQGRR